MGLLSSTGRPVVDLPMRTGSAVLDAVPMLIAALDGTGPAVRPVSDPSPPLPASTVADGIAVVVRTAGSTGPPRHVLLPASALEHAAIAGEDALGSDGRWLLALPADRIAGLMVLLRAVLAGREPTVLDTAVTFTSDRFVQTTAVVGPQPKVSLVPTQLYRLLGDDAGRDALRSFEAVLVGGAAVPPSVAERAVASGVHLVKSYGMTETCGGCVYDGNPLSGVDVVDVDGRLRIEGPVVADGYWGERSHSPFGVRNGQRTFLTGDLGTVADGRVQVFGRADDVLVSGGVNVVPLQVERLLETARGVTHIAITGVPDEEWGTAITAVVVATAGPGPDLDELRARARQISPAAAPRHLVLVDELPELQPGKLDRQRLAEIAAAGIER